MASKCQKFQPNIFNKLKCQSCFGAKDIHTAEALENNKVSKLGVLIFSEACVLGDPGVVLPVCPVCVAHLPRDLPVIYVGFGQFGTWGQTRTIWFPPS